jgi:transposase-like protein
MARYKERIIALDLRRSGKSILEIARTLGVAKSTVSLWCSDIALTKSQIDLISRNRALGIRKGQLVSAERKRGKRLAKVEAYKNQGLRDLKKLSDDAFFAAGLALYLAEGAKTLRRVFFVNSDPRVIDLILRWLEKFFAVPRTGIAPSILINHIHKPRITVVQTFWSRYLGIPASQFRATTFVKTKHKKVYKNHDNYFGTLRFQVLKGTELSYRIMGLIEGLLQHTKKPA